MNLLFIERTIYRGLPDEQLARKWATLATLGKIQVLARATGHPPRSLSGVQFHFLPLIGFEPLDVLLFVVAGTMISLQQTLSRNIDVIVAEDPLISGFVGAGCKILSRIFSRSPQLAVECHGDWEEFPTLYRQRAFPGFVRRVCRLLAAFAFAQAGAVRVVSGFLESKARACTSKPLCRFPAFLSLERLLQLKPRFSDEILFIGDLYPVKGTRFLLDAFFLVRKEIPHARLRLVGEGPERTALEGLASRLGIADAVSFDGHLPHARLEPILGSCGLLVLPSLSEGFGRVIVEAHAAGKPVVASKVGGIPEICLDDVNGFLVEPADPKAIAEKISRLLRDKPLAEKLGANGRALVARTYSVKNYLEAYRAFLSAAAGGSA